MTDLKAAVIDFQQALLKRRVASRFAERHGMEHPSDDARKQYLKDHPNADPSNHTVKKNDDGGGGGESKASPKGGEVHALMDKLHKAYPDLDKDDVKALKSEIDEAEKKGDGKKLQKLKDEVEEWHRREDRYKAKGQKAAAGRGRRPSRVS
jgi:hypothetical protein